jgi:hypothetical protein
MWDNTKNGWNFYTDLNGGGTSVFYQCAGTLNNVTANFSTHASYWSALPCYNDELAKNEDRAYAMDIDPDNIRLFTICANALSRGSIVRPIKD